MSAAPETVPMPEPEVDWFALINERKPPFYLDGVPNAVYHRSSGISKSGLDLIGTRSPAHYITRVRDPKPGTPAQAFGSALHDLVLLPDEFAERYTKMPEDAPNRPASRQVNAKKPSPDTLAAIAWWQAWDAENGDKQIISTKADADKGIWGRSDWDTLHYMRDAVMAHPIAGVFLTPADGIAERSVWWTEEVELVDPIPDAEQSEGKVDALFHKVWKLCKCRPDFMNTAHNTTVDLKSAVDASYTKFGYAAIDFRYHVQQAFYMRGLDAVGLRQDAFIFIAVEKEPPYAVACYPIDPESVRIGRQIYKHDLRIYAACHAKDEWPAYIPLQDLVLPARVKYNPVSGGQTP